MKPGIVYQVVHGFRIASDPLDPEFFVPGEKLLLLVIRKIKHPLQGNSFDLKFFRLNFGNVVFCDNLAEEMMVERLCAA
jgi:hypothetical protein